MAVTDEQFAALEERVTALEENVTDLVTSVGGLTTAVETLTAAVNELRNAQLDTYALAVPGQTVDDVIDYVTALTPTASDVNSEVRFWGNVHDNFSSSEQVILALKTAQGLQSPTNAETARTVSARLKPLVLKWGVHTLTSNGNEDIIFENSGSMTWWGAINVLPQELAGASVLAVCDFANTSWAGQKFSFQLDGKTLNWRVSIDHNSSDSAQVGTFKFKIYWIAAAKNSGGGTIG